MKNCANWNFILIEIQFKQVSKEQATMTVGLPSKREKQQQKNFTANYNIHEKSSVWRDTQAFSTLYISVCHLTITTWKAFQNTEVSSRTKALTLKVVLSLKTLSFHFKWNCFAPRKSSTHHTNRTLGSGLWSSLGA